MSTRIAKVLAATAITFSLGALAAPAASAAPAAPAVTPVVGSAALCLNIPLGLLSFSICI